MTGPIHTDVLVVGAGPAGSSTATTLARAGIAVVLVDKARFPRDKCCGDGLTTGALRRLDTLGLDLSDVASFTPVESIALRSPYGRIAELPLARRGARDAGVARRSDLDGALLALAAASGATVIEGHGLATLDVRAHDEGAACRAALDDGLEIRSRYVVGADGAWSRVRSQLERDRAGPHARRVLEGGWHAWRAYASGVGAVASERLWVWFDTALLPGYGWSFPLAGNVANIGICMRRSTGVTGPALAAAWRRELTSPFLTSLLGEGAQLEAPARSWPIPAGIDKAPIVASGGRVLFVGDAAYAADPFTGEGIGQALETGTACAEAIIALGATSPERVGADYVERIRRSLALEHRMSRALSALLSSTAGARGAVRLVGASPWTRRNAGRWLFEGMPRTLPLTPTRWRRGALTPLRPTRDFARTA